MPRNTVPAGGGSRPERRQLFALAAVLAATALTAGAAVAGLTRNPTPAPPGGPPAVSQTVQAPAPVFEEERGG